MRKRSPRRVPSHVKLALLIIDANIPTKDLRDRRKIPVEFRHIDDLPRLRFHSYRDKANASHDDVAFDAEGDVHQYRRCEKGEDAELSRLDLESLALAFS